MTNERLQITFANPEYYGARTLEPDGYRSILHLDAGVQIVETDGTTTFYPWQAIHAIRKNRGTPDIGLLEATTRNAYGMHMRDEAIVASDGQVLDMEKPELDCA